MIINAKINLWLWLLTGKARDFGPHQDLDISLEYPTVPATPQVEAARKLLHLDESRCDFFHMGALAAAYASISMLRELPQERGAVFLPKVYQPYAAGCWGADMMPPDAATWPYVVNNPSSLDGVITQAQFTATSGGPMTCDTLIWQRQTGYTVTGNIVTVDIAKELGIHATFKINDPANIDFTVLLPPTVYPYAEVAEVIRANTTMIGLMNSAGTIGAFSTALDPVSKVGALCAAIMLTQYRNSVAQGAPVVIPYAVDNADIVWGIDSSQ